MAGREAKNAARQAIERDNTALVVTNYYLLLALVREVTPSGQDYGPPTAASAAMVEKAANQAVAQVGPRLGLDSEGVAKALEELAAIVASVGLGPETNTYSRVPHAMARLAAMHAQLDRWITECGDDFDNTASLVRSCAALTLTCAEATTDDTRKLASHPVEMLTRWRDDAQGVAAKAVRPEWILDGWENICGIWEAAADQGARRDAVAEIAHIVPIVPREAGDWISRFDVRESPTQRSGGWST